MEIVFTDSRNRLHSASIDPVHLRKNWWEVYVLVHPFLWSMSQKGSLWFCAYLFQQQTTAKRKKL